MMFTHSGITGPLVLSASARLGTALRKSGELSAFLDLKPALTPEQLDARILREFESGKNKQFKNAVTKLFPGKLLPVMLKLSGIDVEKKGESDLERRASPICAFDEKVLRGLSQG